jgi:1-acyl-sn-glycerol-3-phosphate acyltransferase
LLYQALKPVVRLAMLIFCRRIIINKRENLKRKGPLLLACNHPNSFLDAAILNDLFKHPVYSLARGDVFKKPFYSRLLNALRILPVYRTSEGVENLGINYETFTECRKIFEKDGIVLIFSEGRCFNQWHLRPLMKGTARLAFSSWEENIPVEVLPVGINYSSFRRFGKNIIINFGEIISKDDFDIAEPDGKRYQAFNDKLQRQLQQLVFEIDKDDLVKQKLLLEKKPSFIAKVILFIPAVIGWLLHAPLYLPIKNFTIKKTSNNDHHDSILIALLLAVYPIYLLLITALAVIVTKKLYLLGLILLLPCTAWAYTQLKPQIDKPGVTTLPA